MQVFHDIVSSPGLVEVYVRKTETGEDLLHLMIFPRGELLEILLVDKKDFVPVVNVRYDSKAAVDAAAPQQGAL